VKIRPYLIVSSLAVVGLLTAACGSSAPANPRAVSVIVPKIEAAMKAATSAHLTGTVRQGGQNFVFDMNFVGHDISGTVSEGGQTTTLLVVSGTTYVEVDQSFLKAANLPSSACSSMCGKWLAVPASQVNPVARSFTLSYVTNLFVKSVPSSVLKDTSDFFKPAELDGRPVLQFKPSPTTIDVAPSGPPYLLYFADPSDGAVTFSQWNAVPPLTAPAPSDIITP
jgi:hypothetical protein